MATFTWNFDTPTGVWRSHAFSRRLYEAALEDTRFMDFVRPVEGFGRKKGETVTLYRVRTISEPASAVLSEGTRIPEDAFQFSNTSITVSEIGRSVPFTSLAEDLSEFDIENPIQQALRDQMGLVLDTMAATEFQNAPIKYTPTGAAAGTFAATASAAGSNWNIYHCERIRDYMYDTLKAPGWGGKGKDYMAIVRTLGIRGIKRDPDWEQWHIYTDPQSKANSEVGRIEQIRFVETNHEEALQEVASSTLGEGVVFGDDAVAMAEVLTPELRAQTNVGQDFGRQHAVAWYGILNFGVIWNTTNAGECRIVHVTSS